MPDAQQVNCADIAERELPPNTICVDTGEGDFVGIEGSTNVAGIDAFMWIDPADIPVDNPGVDMLGLISFKAEVTDPDQPAVFVIHGDEPLEDGAKLYKWDGFEWRELPDTVAVISGDRLSVTLTLEDGGEFPIGADPERSSDDRVGQSLLEAHPVDQKLGILGDHHEVRSALGLSRSDRELAVVDVEPQIPGGGANGDVALPSGEVVLRPSTSLHILGELGEHLDRGLEGGPVGIGRRPHLRLDGLGEVQVSLHQR